MQSSYNTVLQQILTMMKTPIGKLNGTHIVCDIWAGLHFALLGFR